MTANNTMDVGSQFSTSRSSSTPHRRSPGVVLMCWYEDFVFTCPSLGLYHDPRYSRAGSAEDCVLVKHPSLFRGLGFSVSSRSFVDMPLLRCSEWVDTIVGFLNVYTNLALDFGAMDSLAVSTLLHESFFCAFDLLDVFMWTSTLVQIATIMMYDWTARLWTMVPVDIVDGFTSAVVLQSTSSCQQFGRMIRRPDVIGVSGVSHQLSKYCHGFAHRDHIGFCGLWIDLREDLVYHGVVLEESTMTGLAEESNSPMLQESNVGFYLIEDLIDPSLPRSSKWIDCVLLPASCNEVFVWTEGVFDSLLAICIDWFMLIIDLVVLVLQKCNEWWIFTMIVDIVDMSSWTPWSCKGSLMIWNYRWMHRCCDQMM